MRRMAIESLYAISPKMPDEAWKAVVKAVSDKDLEVANSAAYGLMMNAAKYLRPSLTDKDPEIFKTALESTDPLGKNGQSTASVHPDAQ